MNVLLTIIAILFYVFGAFAVLAAKSDIQIIVAVLCFGFGTMILGLMAILRELQPDAVAKASPIEDAREPIAEPQHANLDRMQAHFAKRRVQS